MQVGPYELIAELGRGGMGVVHRARRVDLDREFALKVIRPGTGLSPVQVARFQREARAAAALAGTSGIVTVHDIGVAADGTLYLAMDLIDGRPLDEVVAHEPLPAPNVARLGAQIARAVQAAHDRGVLHRDIKPANVLLDRAGAPHLADFGLAAAEQLDQDATRLTKSGEIFGTAAYMPPEQARGEAVDGTADVYSLGATLYEMAAGGPPFARESTFATLMEVLHAPPPMGPLRRADVPRDLQTIIAHCLAKSPGDRYPTPEALAADLDRFAAGEPILARPEGAAQRLWRVVRRRPRTVAGVAAVLGLAAAGGGAAWWVAGKTAGDETRTTQVQQAEQRADRTTRLVELWAALHRDGLAHLLVCEDAWRERPLEPGAAAAALTATQELCERLGAAEHQLPRAWAALATLLAGDRDAGQRTLDALAADPSSGALTRMMIVRGYLARWSRGVVLPTVEIGATGIEVDGRMEHREFVQFRERAAAILGTLDGDPIWDRIQGGGEFRDYLAAVALLVNKQFAEAGPAFRALQDSPEFAGEAALFGGLARFLSGEPEEAIVVVVPAVDRGWPQAIELAATANLTVAARNHGNPAAARIALDAAVNLGRMLAGTKSTEVRPRTFYALCLRQRGEFLRTVGGDATADYDAAKRLLDEAVAMAPPTPHLLRDRAQVGLLRAQHAAERGRDPLPAAQAAIADARACVARKADDRHAWLALGEAWGLIGERLAARGEPSRHAFDKAIHAMDRSIEVRADAPALIRRAVVLRQRADAHAAAGGDPLPDLRVAARDLDTVLAKHPNLLEALAHRALVHWTTADWLPKPADAVAELRAGLAVADRTLQLAPEHPTMHETRGGLRYTLAQHEVRAGRPGGPLLDGALADLNRALTLNPGNLGGLVMRANIHAVRAELAQMQRRDPMPHYQAAIADFGAALAIAPRNTDALYNRAVLYMSLGDAHKRRREDPAGAYRAAITDFTTCTQLAPSLWQAHAGKGAAFEELGKGGEALRAFEAAAKLNPREPGVRQAIARLRAQQPRRDGSK